MLCLAKFHAVMGGSALGVVCVGSLGCLAGAKAFSRVRRRGVHSLSAATRLRGKDGVYARPAEVRFNLRRARAWRFRLSFVDHRLPPLGPPFLSGHPPLDTRSHPVG